MADRNNQDGRKDNGGNQSQKDRAKGGRNSQGGSSKSNSDKSSKQ